MQVSLHINTQNSQEVEEAINFLSQYSDSKPVKAPVTKEQGETKGEVASKTKKSTEAKSDSKASKVTLDDLKGFAQAAVEKTGDRKKVKDVISEYAERLSDVKSKDYDDLADKLKAL